MWLEQNSTFLEEEKRDKRFISPIDYFTWMSDFSPAVFETWKRFLPSEKHLFENLAAFLRDEKKSLSIAALKTLWTRLEYWRFAVEIFTNHKHINLLLIIIIKYLKGLFNRNIVQTVNREYQYSEASVSACKIINSVSSLRIHYRCNSQHFAICHNAPIESVKLTSKNTFQGLTLKL